MSRRRWIGILSVALLVAAAAPATRVGAGGLSIGAPSPDVAGGPWIGSPPLTIEGLRGRVTLVEFWTYG